MTYCDTSILAPYCADESCEKCNRNKPKTNPADRQHLIDELGDELTKSLEMCIRAAVENDELIAQYNRLRGTNLKKRLAPIEMLVDKATGQYEKEWTDYFDFVRDYVWKPLILRKHE